MCGCGLDTNGLGQDLAVSFYEHDKICLVT
jgi:hypothetical protein